MYEKIRHLMADKCPFVNLPETHNGRWGEGLTAADMEKCMWVRPEIVAQIEFLEWTESGHLRALQICRTARGQNPRSVAKEHPGEA